MRRSWSWWGRVGMSRLRKDPHSFPLKKFYEMLAPKGEFGVQQTFSPPHWAIRILKLCGYRWSSLPSSLPLSLLPSFFFFLPSFLIYSVPTTCKALCYMLMKVTVKFSLYFTNVPKMGHTSIALLCSFRTSLIHLICQGSREISNRASDSIQTSIP